MPERRRSPRYKKRLPVIFDDGRQSRVGFSINFSKGGISIGATHALPPGTELKGKFTTREGQDVSFEAVVQWSQQIRGMPGIASQNTMGLLIRNVSGMSYESFLESLVKSKAPEDPYVSGPAGTKSTGATARGGGARFPIGLRGQTVFFLAGDDFFIAPGRGRPRLVLGRVATWFEVAVQKALAPQLREFDLGAGERIEFTHKDNPDIHVGSKVEVFAQLIISEEEETRLTFDVGLLSGGAEVVRGLYVWLMRKD